MMHVIPQFPLHPRLLASFGGAWQLEVCTAFVILQLHSGACPFSSLLGPSPAFLDKLPPPPPFGVLHAEADLSVNLASRQNLACDRVHSILVVLATAHRVQFIIVKKDWEAGTYLCICIRMLHTKVK